MIFPPLPSAKSYHWLRSVFTLNDASVSSLSGDLYHRFILLFDGRKAQAVQIICYLDLFRCLYIHTTIGLMIIELVYFFFRPYLFMKYGLIITSLIFVYIEYGNKVKRFIRSLQPLSLYP